MAAFCEGNALDAQIRKRVSEQVFRQFQTTNEDDNKEKGKKQKGETHTESAFTVTNILWLLAAASTVYYLEFVTTAFSDPRVYRVWFYTGVVLICVNVTIALFLILYLSFIRKVDSDDWDKKYPAAIPVATGAFCLGALCVTVGLWPVWNILTPVFLFILFMGFIVVVTMVPSF